MEAPITVEGKGPVRTVMLRRPPINALDAEALQELRAVADTAGADPACRVVVVASAIEGIFCTGGDLKFWRTYPRERALEVSLAGRQAFAWIARLSVPTIALIDGQVIGDGIAPALSCDVRLASERTVFRLPEAGYGFIPGWGTLRRLAGAIGPARTLDMVLTGHAVDAETALAWGLVSRVKPRASLGEELEITLRGLLSASPTALSLAKTALAEGHDPSDPTPERETAAFLQAWGSEDWREGIAALLEKRPPRFSARRPLRPREVGG